MLPKVSIGIPTRNRSALLLRALRSALAQSYTNIEILVSDDASTDDTLARVAEIADPRIVVFQRETHLGLVGNFDFCLRNATGEFFLLLGSDDLLFPRAIEGLLNCFLGPDDVGVSWCTCRIADTNAEDCWITDAGPALEDPAEMIAALWDGKRGPRLSGILVRTSDALAVGGFRTRYGDLCDIGLWGAVALRHKWVACVSEPLVQYTNHYGTITSGGVVSKWQEWAHLVHADLLETTDAVSQAKLEAAKRNFISAITLTILVQTIGKPGWAANALREAVRSPGALLTSYIARRAFKDGWKVLRLLKGKAEKKNTPARAEPFHR